jgi:glucokinase
VFDRRESDVGTRSLYASVDLGGTNVKAALASEDGNVEISDSVPTKSHEGPKKVLDRIAELVGQLSDQANCQVEAIGMAVPGLADLAQGVTKFLPNLPTQWRDVAVRDILGSQLGCAVYLLNDVRMATLGELRYGHGQAANTMAFFALGTGIGGGVVVDGKLRLGPLGAAGELGHQTILPDGPRCGCGNCGCLETLASGPAIVAHGVRLMRSGLAPKLYQRVAGDDSRITPKEMAAAAESGDATVEEVIARAARFLGIGISNVIVTLHPDLIVLGGGVAEMGELLFAPVREAVTQRVHMLPADSIAIEPSKLGSMAGTLGGIALAAQGGLPS